MAKLNSKKLFKKFILLSNILRDNINHSFIKEIKIRKKILLYKIVSTFETIKLKLNLTQYKFEEKLLYILASFLRKFYKKKVEFNIINLRSIAFNSDIFTRILTLKSKSKTIYPHKAMKFIFNKAIINKTNKIKEKTAIRKKLLQELLQTFRKKRIENQEIMQVDGQYKYSTFIYKCLNNIYSFYKNKDETILTEDIFNSIYYKNISGIRLEIKGRLT
jgi:hypothetical protein